MKYAIKEELLSLNGTVKVRILVNYHDAKLFGELSQMMRIRKIGKTFSGVMKRNVLFICCLVVTQSVFTVPESSGQVEASRSDTSSQTFQPVGADLVERDTAGLGDTATVQALFELLNRQIERGWLNDALATSRQLLEEPAYDLSPEERAEVLTNKADCFLELRQNDSLVVCYQELQSLAVEFAQTINPFMLQLIEGVIAKDNGEYLKALELFYEVLEYEDEEFESKRLIVFSQTSIGLLFQSLGHFERSVKHYQKALLLAKEMGDTNRIMGTLLNLGICYKNLDSLSLAENTYRDVLNLAVADSNFIYQAMSYYNLANVTKRGGHYSKAHAQIDTSLIISENLELNYGVLLGMTTRGLIFQEQGEGEKALEYLNAAEQLNQDFQDQDVAIEINRVKALAYEQIGEFEQAFACQKKYLKDKELTGEAESNRLVLEWESKLQREEAEELERKIVEAKIKQRSTNRQLILLAAFFLAIITGGLLIMRQIRDKNSILQQLVLEERENYRLQIEMKNREALSQGLYMQSFLQLLDDIKTKINGLSKKKQLGTNDWSSLIKHMDQGLPSEILEEFKVRFVNVEKDFIENLKAKCSDLTPNELNIASLLRLNLNSKEIAKLTNRSLGTINNVRSSIRKKLDLDDDDNLSSFLLNL